MMNSKNKNLRIYQWLNGLTLVPTLYWFLKYGLFEFMVSSDKIRSYKITEIISAINPSKPYQKIGSYCSAMRTLALQGWITMEGLDENTIVQLTNQGIIVAEIALLHYSTLGKVNASIRNSKKYHIYFREDTNRYREQLREYIELIELSKQKWRIESPSGTIGHRVWKHLCSYLDGLLICPTMVALGLPVFKSEANLIKQSQPSIFDLFDKETNSLYLREMNNLFHQDFLIAAFDLLMTLGIITRIDKEEKIALTEEGIDLVQQVANFGMPVSYLPSYERFEDILFQDSYQVKILEDPHINRIMNVWGSGGSSVIKDFRKEVCKKILALIFNKQPLSQQPIGIADMGCGSGVPLKEMVDYIINHTTRGRYLKEYPLVVIGADYSSKSRDRTRDTLKIFKYSQEIIVKVIHGDISNPESFDTSIRNLGLKVRDLSLNRERDAEAKDFLHTHMFLLHDRELKIRSRQSALSIFYESVKKVNIWALQDALNKLKISIKPTFSQEKLVDICISQFTTCCLEKGELIPAVVVAADLIQLISRWLPYIRYGLVLLEPHVPRVNEMLEDVPKNPNLTMRIEVDPSPCVWGVHYISGQFLMPYYEHELALTLAGLSPHYSMSTGIGSISLGFWGKSEDIYYNPTLQDKIFNFA